MSLALAASYASTSCSGGDSSQFDGQSGGKGGTRSSGGSAGTTGLVLPDGSASGATGGADGGGTGPGPWRLPNGFTKAEFGGFELGEAIDPNNPNQTPQNFGNADAGDQCGTTIVGVVRDFTPTHPDFEHYCCGDQKGLVNVDLGTDQKPVYAPPGATPFSTGPAAFAQWYRTVPTVNKPFYIYISLQPNGSVYTFHSSSFFPLDGKGFGNQGNPHNFHFTTEIHTRFRYAGGETFSFTGDDDVFVFVNGKRVIDLGGVHTAENQQVKLDAIAANIGIVKGNIYDLDLFHAERHTTQSNFRIDTTLEFTNCGYVPPEIIE
jgi:fibro-slime domain-containing protein